MCGRFLLTSPAQAIAEAFGVEPPADLAPRWNIAPGQPILAVRTDDAGGGRLLASLRWGLVPWRTKEAPRVATLINARSESAAESRTFREAFYGRRCLVPADGFYEWQSLRVDDDRGPPQAELFAARSDRSVPPSRPRQPVLIDLQDDAPFAIAGLWERWRPRAADGAPLESCALLTTEPNALMAPIHDRMPVILPRADWSEWLAPDVSDAERLQSLLRPYPADAMRARRVSAWVNDPRHDDARCVEPI